MNSTWGFENWGYDVNTAQWLCRKIQKDVFFDSIISKWQLRFLRCSYPGVYVAPVYRYIRKIIGIWKKPHSNVSQWLAWDSSARSVLTREHPSSHPISLWLSERSVPQHRSTNCTSRLRRLTQCRSGPTSQQIWVYFLQARTQADTIKLSHTPTRHHKNLLRRDLKPEITFY